MIDQTPPPVEEVKPDPVVDAANPAPVVEPKTDEKVIPPEDTFDESTLDPDILNYKPEAETPPQEEEDEVEKEERLKVEAIMQKKYGGTIEQIEKKAQINTFFNEHPEFGKYKGATEKYLAHPKFKGLDVKHVVNIVAADDLMKIGAKKEREAQAKAAETSNPGTSVRTPNAGAIDWSKATHEQVAAQMAVVIGRQGN